MFFYKFATVLLLLLMQEIFIYLQLGFEHITDPGGYDHILFIAAMTSVFSFNKIKELFVTVTAFTLGHSLSLAFAVLGYAPFDSALIEFLIPVSIILTATSNLFLPERRERFLPAYFAVFFFGLIHGFGFANYLKSLLGKSGEILIPLLGFNIGLEVGQILAALILLLVAGGLRRVKFSQRDTVLIINAFVVGVAMTVLQKVWLW